MEQALQVFVRGFQDKATGNRIVSILENYGFTVAECFPVKKTAMVV
jgi:hypothetical protein